MDLCQQFKRNCPGKAVAKECTADRVLLSSYMVKHWAKIGYIPDTEIMNEVDQEEPEVQVGGKTKDQILIPESSFTSKYRSVIVKGFRAETPSKDIMEIIKLEGVVPGLCEEDILKNEKSGNFTVENLKPEECLLLIESMNRKRFLGKQIFVTSVVADSPVKQPPVKPQPEASASLSDEKTYTQNPVNVLAIPNLNIPHPKIPDLGQPLVARIPGNSDLVSDSANPEDNPFTDFVFGPPSPGVQEKIDLLEKHSTGSKLIITTLPSKRKSEGSPEMSRISNKEKKILKSAEKKKNKQEVKSNKTIQVHKSF